MAVSRHPPILQTQAIIVSSDLVLTLGFRVSHLDQVLDPLRLGPAIVWRKDRKEEDKMAASRSPATQAHQVMSIQEQKVVFPSNPTLAKVKGRYPVQHEAMMVHCRAGMTANRALTALTTQVAEAY